MRTPVPGYRYFECDDCGQRWRTPTRDCYSPSAEFCDDCDGATTTLYNQEPADLPVDANGNLLIAETREAIEVHTPPHVFVYKDDDKCFTVGESELIPHGTPVVLNDRGEAVIDLADIKTISPEPPKLAPMNAQVHVIKLAEEYTLRNSVQDRQNKLFIPQVNEQSGEVAYINNRLNAIYAVKNVGMIIAHKGDGYEITTIVSPALSKYASKDSCLKPDYYSLLWHLYETGESEKPNKQEVADIISSSLNELTSYFEGKHKRLPKISLRVTSKAIITSLQ